MSTLGASLNSFLSEGAGSCSIKLSGGEPLADFPHTRKVARLIRAKFRRIGTKPVISLCVNLAHLRKEHLRFLCAHDIDLSVTLCLNSNLGNRPLSRIGMLKELACRRPVTVNLVITPAAVAGFFASFVFLVDQGLKEFNFLPAFYVAWPATKIKTLRKEFAKIHSFLRRSPRGLLNIKNLSASARTPLFNDGVVVDCQGDVYLNNFFLMRAFKKLSPQFCLGNIHHGIFLKKPLETYRPTLEALRPHLGARCFSSTLAVNRILSSFVAKIRHEAL